MKTNQDYLAAVEISKLDCTTKLYNTIKNNIPKGFSEELSYGMIGFVVPKEIYPNGYHCNPKLPLPFVSLASQKNAISLYHMGIYADNELFDWFQAEYSKHCKTKLDMGKSCIRFKRMDDVPFELVAALMQKMSVSQWIEIYEKSFLNKTKNPPK